MCGLPVQVAPPRRASRRESVYCSMAALADFALIRSTRTHPALNRASRFHSFPFMPKKTLAPNPKSALANALPSMSRSRAGPNETKIKTTMAKTMAKNANPMAHNSFANAHIQVKINAGHENPRLMASHPHWLGRWYTSKVFTSFHHCRIAQAVDDHVPRSPSTPHQGFPAHRRTASACFP